MKKLLALLLAAFFGLSAASAQDLIVKRDSSRVEALVAEIAPETVRYKRFSNSDGPTYVLPAVQIEYIRFANGEVERFAPAQPAAQPAGETQPAAAEKSAVPAEPAKPAAAEKPARPAAEPAPAAPAAGPEYIVRRYEIGEYYERDGVRGVVCKLTDDATHGLLLSLDEIYLPWSVGSKSELKAVGADAHDDGEVNMQTVARYIADNGLARSEEHTSELQSPY